jgi:predicted RNA-binding Zn-ribbon protein involved in translation (DUF1610 family)
MGVVVCYLTLKSKKGKYMKKWINKSMFRKASLGLFVIGILFHLIYEYLVESSSNTEYYIFLLSMSFFLYSFSFQSSKLDAYNREVFTCQSCNEVFNLNQVRFGLCPKCGTKLDGCKRDKYLY